MEIQNFKAIADRYHVIFFDAYGVLKNSLGVLDGIERTFDYLIGKDLDYYIVTNDASRGPKALAQAYVEQGLKMIDDKKIISSACSRRSICAQRYGQAR